MTTIEKIFTINGYNEYVGSPIRYQAIGERYYRNNDIETCDDFDEVSENHINDAYEDVKVLSQNID